MKRAALWLAIAALGLACAKYPRLEQVASTELYVLLPDPGGAVGALVVTQGTQATTLATPRAAATIGRHGAIETSTASEADVRQIFGAALGAQPARPSTFLLYFLTGSDELTPESAAHVVTVLGAIAKYPAPEVLVIGHTDSVGTDEHNDRLSLQRAERLRDRLIQRGVPSAGIAATGRGKRELLVPTADQVAEPKNRRVEIVVR
jgi:outer membrane protein OmpA-like peptidoglycan-associated protein